MKKTSRLQCLLDVFIVDREGVGEGALLLLFCLLLFVSLDKNDASAKLRFFCAVNFVLVLYILVILFLGLS